MDALRLVAANDDFTGRESGLSFHAVEGKVYFVSVTSFGEILGDFTLRWYPGRILEGRRELTCCLALRDGTTLLDSAGVMSSEAEEEMTSLIVGTSWRVMT